MPKVQRSLTTLGQKEKLSKIKGKWKVIRILHVKFPKIYRICLWISYIRNFEIAIRGVSLET